AFLLAGALEIGGPATLAALPASDRPPASLPALAHAAALAWLGASILFWRRRPRAAGALALGALLLAWESLAPWPGSLRSPRALVDALLRERRAGEPVVEMGEIVSSVPFALREPVYLYRVPRENALPDSVTRARWILDEPALDALAARSRTLWIVGPRASVEGEARRLGGSPRVAALWRELALERVEAGSGQAPGDPAQSRPGQSFPAPGR